MHNLKPNTAYNLVRVNLAIDASVDEGMVVDGLNETLRQACYDEAGGICDWQFPGLITGTHTLHYRTVTTAPDPEEGEVFAPDVEYRVWVVQNAEGRKSAPEYAQKLASTTNFVDEQLLAADRFLNSKTNWTSNPQAGKLIRCGRTASEACGLRLLRRVREGRVKPDSLHLYFHDQDGKYARIPVTEDGDLRWHPPLGFFDWRDSELF